jgi:hypothetical protein
MNTRDKDPKRVKKVPAEQGKRRWPVVGRSKARRRAARLRVNG